MADFIDSNRLRLWALGGALALGLTQAGCAHPVVVEPSVVVSSRIGHAPIHAQIGWPAPVVVVPPPRVIYAPPAPVVLAPPVYRPAPGWAPGHGRAGWNGHRQHRGHDRDHGHDGDRDHGHDSRRDQREDRPGWRR